MSHTAQRHPRSCYLFGYNGKQNTGSDARLVCIVEQLLESFGDDLKITVATFDVESTKQVLKRFQNVRFSRIHPLSAVPFFWQIATNDVTVLVEGSTFKQNFSQTLLHVFLMAAWFSKFFGRRCIAYAVDVGELTKTNQFLTRHVCQSIDLLITRTHAARDRLFAMGVQRPVLTGTDPAFRFEADAESVPLRGPADAVSKASLHRPLLGVAPIEFYHWPVCYRLYGPRSERYHWPHYFTWNAERRALSARTVAAWVELIRHAQRQHGFDVALIAMEALDETFCRKILLSLDNSERERVRLVSSRESTPHEIVPLLRSLSFLATSRYHACVLSMQTAVPQMAVAHDERLRSIYAEVGLDGQYLLDPAGALEPGRLPAAFDRLVQDATTVQQRLDEFHRDYFLPRCDSNVEALRTAWQAWKWHSPPLSGATAGFTGAAQSTSA